jgi:hypothetical protein
VTRRAGRAPPRRDAMVRALPAAVTGSTADRATPVAATTVPPTARAAPPPIAARAASPAPGRTILRAGVPPESLTRLEVRVARPVIAVAVASPVPGHTVLRAEAPPEGPIRLGVRGLRPVSAVAAPRPGAGRTTRPAGVGRRNTAPPTARAGASAAPEGVQPARPAPARIVVAMAPRPTAARAAGRGTGARAAVRTAAPPCRPATRQLAEALDLTAHVRGPVARATSAPMREDADTGHGPTATGARPRSGAGPSTATVGGARRRVDRPAGSNVEARLPRTGLRLRVTVATGGTPPGPTAAAPLPARTDPGRTGRAQPRARIAAAPAVPVLRPSRQVATATTDGVVPAQTVRAARIVPAQTVPAAPAAGARPVPAAPTDAGQMIVTVAPTLGRPRDPLPVDATGMAGRTRATAPAARHPGRAVPSRVVLTVRAAVTPAPPSTAPARPCTPELSAARQTSRGQSTGARSRCRRTSSPPCSRRRSAPSSGR